MGKTAAGAVWLDSGKVSPYDYYQFWRNTEDADVIKFLKIFTEISLEQIDEMKSWEGSAKINDAKKILAFEATKLCHGEAEAHKAEQTAITAFEQGGTAGMPEVTLEAKTYKAYELFVAAGLATSNGESRRLIAGGGAKIDDVKVESDSQEITIKDGMKLSSGKKKHVVVKC
jgi:tyrosyl-tRNA synthetase